MQRDFKGQVLNRFTWDELQEISVLNAVKPFKERPFVERPINSIVLRKHYQRYLKDFPFYEIERYIEDAKTNKAPFIVYTQKEYLVFFILELNLEQLPLYMNTTELIDEVVRFRLKLNK